MGVSNLLEKKDNREGIAEQQAPVSNRISALLKQIPSKLDDASVRAMKTTGAARLAMELEGQPKAADAYILRYNELVLVMADIIRKEYPKITEEQFMTEVWGIINSNLDVQYGENKFGFMYESFQTNKFDCDTSAFLVYDVARQLGVSMKMIYIPAQFLVKKGDYTRAHALVKTDNFFFETTSGQYYGIHKLASHYYMWQVLDESQIQAVSYDNLGVAYNKQGNFKQAIEDFNKAIGLDSQFVDAYYARGLAYYNQGDSKQAIEDFSKVIELNPEYAKAYNYRGLAYRFQENYKQAIEDYNKAIDLDPKYAAAYNNRGLVYDAQGNYERAIEDFDKAIELDPKFAKAYNNRGNAYYHSGEKIMAEKDYKKARHLGLSV